MSRHNLTIAEVASDASSRLFEVRSSDFSRSPGEDVEIGVLSISRDGLKYFFVPNMALVEGLIDGGVFRGLAGHPITNLAVTPFDDDPYSKKIHAFAMRRIDELE